MELEKLTKTQIILLTLLTSFVTSIATGIVTVTLLAQAPPAVTNTISKVIETTVEKIVPERNQGATVIKTIIIKEESLITEAVSVNKYLLGDIYQKGDDGVFVGFGFVLSPNIFVSDSALVSDDTSYMLVYQNGATTSARVILQNEEKGIAILEIPETEFSSSFADINEITLGQTSIVLYDAENTTIQTSVVSGFSVKETEDGEERTAILTTTSLKTGGLVINTDGGIMGINITREGNSSIIPASFVLDLENSLSSEEVKEEKIDETE